MAKETHKDRLLETWVPPQDAGDPIGFIATSFTFNAQFFEEDCLTSFLQMESDYDTEGLSYLIEREEKLGKVACAMVMVDQHHSDSRQRNIRWDLLPFRMSTGIQHAKISLLVWGNTIRLVISSANLTEEGYRRNQEIYAVFDASENASVPLEVFRQALDYLETMIKSGVTAVDTIKNRGERLIALARKTISSWNLTDSNADPNACQVWPVFIRPHQSSAFEQIRQRWQARYSFLPDALEVISPFFDTEYHEAHPLAKLGDLLTPMAGLEISTSAEKDKEASGVLRVHAPAYYAERLKERLTVRWLPEMTEEEVDGRGRKEPRPLHMKALRAYKGNWCMVLLGSSNFTTAGLGTSRDFSNYEANVLYLSSSSKDPDSYNLLSRCLPGGIKLEEGAYQLEETVRTDEHERYNIQPLPDCIWSAEADLVEHKTVIRLTMDAAKMLAGLTVQSEDGTVIYDTSKDGAVDMFEYTWLDPLENQKSTRTMPAGFDVKWSGSEKRAWLPLNIMNYDVLPPPEELKNLPFHILLQVLTSARPLHVLLRRYNRKLKDEAKEETPEDPMTDPHKRVDTSGFLLQRTRRISYAFNAIREKLSRPVTSMQALHWRLYGPVGLQALVNAILSDSEDAELKIPEERAFFLAELILELSTLQTTTATNYLPAETVRAGLNQFIAGLKPKLLDDAAIERSWIRPYVEKTLKNAMEATV